MATSQTYNALYIGLGKATSSGGWSTTSDRNKKAKIKSVSVLNRLKNIEISSWKFNRDTFDDSEVERKYSESKGIPYVGIKKKNEGTTNEPLHIGVMAQDFNKTFGCNFGSDEEINYTNTIGVCMRAIQELSQQLDNAVREIRTLKRILRANGTITDEIIAEDRDNEAIRRLEIAKYRQDKREAKILANNSENEADDDNRTDH